MLNYLKDILNRNVENSQNKKSSVKCPNFIEIIYSYKKIDLSNIKFPDSSV